MCGPRAATNDIQSVLSGSPHISRATCLASRLALADAPSPPPPPSPQASLVSGPAVRLFVKTGNYDDVLMKVQLAILRPDSASETVSLDLTLGFDDQGTVEFFIEPVTPGGNAQPSEVHISGFVNPVPDNSHELTDSEDGDMDDEDDDDEEGDDEDGDLDDEDDEEDDDGEET